MRPAERGEIPDLDVLLREANRLLASHDLPLCEAIEPVADLDTANINLMGQAEARAYAIKLRLRNLGTLERQHCVANLLRERTGLPIPEHLCYSQDGEALPLVVMERMPGQQLRLLLRGLPKARAAALATDWGRCIARFHGASLDPDECGGGPDIVTAHAGYVRWLQQKMPGVFALLANDPGWPPDEVAAMQGYLADREGSVGEPAVPGLIKRDQGLRDALGVLEPTPHVSALLDWELVEPGDTIAEVVDLYVMIFAAGLERVWPAFREGYEAEAGAPIARCAQLEYYTMARTLIALTWQGQEPARIDQAQKLTRLLLKGESPLTA